LKSNGERSEAASTRDDGERTIDLKNTIKNIRATEFVTETTAVVASGGKNRRRDITIPLQVSVLFIFYSRILAIKYRKLFRNNRAAN